MTLARRTRRRRQPLWAKLRIHGVTAEEWRRRYGVEPFTHACSECGRPCTTTQPFVIRHDQGVVHGLESPPCPCGNERTPYAMLFDELPR